MGSSEAMKLTLQPEAELQAHTTTEAEVLSKILNQMHAINFEAPAAAGGDKKPDAAKPADGKPAGGKPAGPKPGDAKPAADAAKKAEEEAK